MRALALVACTVATWTTLIATAGAVVGGLPVPSGELPWQGEIVFRSTPDATAGKACGVSLIAPDRGLTSARCAFGRSPLDFDVVVGRSDLSSSDGERIAIVGFSVVSTYEQFEDAGNNAAVLLLANPSTLSPIPVISTAEEPALAAPGTAATVAGWGSLRRAFYLDPARAHRADQTLEADATCRERIGTAFAVGEMMCATGAVVVHPDGSQELAGPCDGDGGTGLVVPAIASPDPTVGSDWRLVGVTAGLRNLACGTAGLPFVYAPVANAAIRALIQSSAPPVQPYPTSRPVMSGEPRVGSVVSCAPAVFAGEVTAVATYLRFESADASGSGISGFPATLSPTDAGWVISCVSSATGPGGAMTSTSTRHLVTAAPSVPASGSPPTGSTIAPPPVTPVVVTGREPQSIAERLRSDKRAPTAAFTFRRCVARRCRLTIVANDDLTDNVAAVLVRWRTRAPRRSGFAWARQSEDGRWRVTISRLPAGRVVTFTAVAVDRAGNQARPVTLGVKLPR